jgi:hypothetical protein
MTRRILDILRKASEPMTISPDSSERTNRMNYVTRHAGGRKAFGLMGVDLIVRIEHQKCPVQML